MKSEVISTIYAESVAKRRLPVNFHQEHLGLFEGELERVIPATRLLRFRDVLASPEGLLFKGTKILPESFAFPYHLDDWPLRSVLKFLATNYIRRRRKIESEVLWITDYWSTGHFHWLTDALTRLFVVRDRLADLLLLLPGSYQTREVVESSLRAFGVRNVDYIERDEVVECRNLLMPSHTAPSGHFNTDAIRGVRNVLLSSYGSNGEERLYITRSKAAKRRLVNENEILPILADFGFQTICTEEMSFDHQVQVCSRASNIVSNHGAGLTNMLFMRDGGSVLELRHQSDCINNCYFTLASALNFNYFYQTCSPQHAAADPHEADLLVDPHRLKENLALLFGSGRTD
ncbi:MAG TPA: glycosyltransferase family 61 protein [Pyrinomonadaceae bacterium]|nr:glycosyltransferase family 61 protein [Pyrinomonadaceae bacterium]